MTDSIRRLPLQVLIERACIAHYCPIPILVFEGVKFTHLNPEAEKTFPNPQSVEALCDLKEIRSKLLSSGEKLLVREVEVSGRVFEQRISLEDPQMYIFMLDITERKRSEKKLQFLSRISNAAVDPIIMTNLEFKIIYTNDAFRLAFGYSEEEVIGQSPDILNAEPMAEQIQQEIYRTVASGKTWRGEALQRRKDCTTFPGELTIFPMLDDQGDIFAYACLDRNITERKKAEKEKAKLEQMLRGSQKLEAVGRLAGGIAHDFNNILSAVTGHAELMLVQLLSPEDSLHMHAQTILRATKRATDLTRQLLVYSRQCTDTQKIPISLNKIICETERMLSRLLREDIDLQTSLDPNLPLIIGDPSQMQQIITNLVINSRDAMPTGGSLFIRTSVDRESEHLNLSGTPIPTPCIVLEIADTGCGIKPEDLERIFEPFFTTKGPDHGTGLGLSMVEGIISQMNGSLTVTSTPQKGTTFTICLPAAPEGTQEEGTDRHFVQIPQQESTILVIEDNEMMRDVILEILQQYGFEVLVAANGREAIVLASQYEETIDLLLTDVIMPGLQGPEAAKAILGIHPETKVLFMSGYPKDTLTLQYQVDPEARVLTKPLKSSTLIREIKAAIGDNEEGGERRTNLRAKSFFTQHLP